MTETLARAGGLVGLVLLFGTLAFWAGFDPGWPDRTRRRLAALARTGVGLALAGNGAWLLAEAVAMSGAHGPGPAVAALSPVLLRTRFGHLLLVRLGLLLAAAVAGRGWLAAMLAGTALGLQAGFGHLAARGGADGLALVTIEAAHVLAAGLWLGALPALVAVLGTLRPPEAAALSRRFTPVGLACVAAILASALVQGRVLIGGVAALGETDYGRIAFVKIALFTLLAALAAVNRFLFTPALAGAAADRAQWRLRASILAETALGLAVLAAAAALASTEPAM